MPHYTLIIVSTPTRGDYIDDNGLDPRTVFVEADSPAHALRDYAASSVEYRLGAIQVAMIITGTVSDVYPGPAQLAAIDAAVFACPDCERQVLTLAQRDACDHAECDGRGWEERLFDGDGDDDGDGDGKSLHNGGDPCECERCRP